VPAIWHAVLRGLAWLVRVRLVPSLAALAPLMFHAINRLSWGEHRGGMFIDVEGVDRAGVRARRSWHLVAEGDAGPLIPSMACEAIIRQCVVGTRPAAGARAATHELEVADYEPLLTRNAIVTGRRSVAPFLPFLYERVLGDAWASLPETLRAMHSVHRSSTVKGRANVRRGTSVFARLIAAVFRFPSAAADVPVEVRFDVHRGRETWTRRFGQSSFSSEQFEGAGRYEHLVCERFGAFTLGLALVLDGERLRLVVRHWDFLGIPLPRALAPRSTSHEREEDGRFRFDVEISHPLAGVIVHYRGWLAPV
jgi:hypothetical protein